jgi:hypothetical protein
MVAILFLVSDQTCKETETMQTHRIVARLLDCCAPFMHCARLRALYDVSSSAVSGSWLSLSSLACGTSRATALRHRIKCVDRLIGNTHLRDERQAVYRALAHRWLCDLPQLLIVVDWSSLSADMQWHWLRASVVVEGRSLTLYEEVHPRCHLANRGVHRRFVDRLAQLLPPSDRPPIVITDAGFRTTWFQLLAKRNWLWIGRIRNRDFVRQADGEWFAAKTLYVRARATAQDLGLYESVRSNPIRCRFVLIKKAATGRRRRYPSGKEQQHSQARKIARCQREPWLLSCAPQLAHLSAQAIVNLYAQRMRIEQQFRDTKNCALGMGLRQARSAGILRLQALLLIAHVATLAKRLIGEAGRAHNLQLQLMSTNRKDRAEISVMTLATRLIAQPALLRSLTDPWLQLQQLRRQVTEAFSHAVQTA